MTRAVSLPSPAGCRTRSRNDSASLSPRDLLDFVWACESLPGRKASSGEKSEKMTSSTRRADFRIKRCSLKRLLITKATPLAGAAARTETRCVPTADAALLVYLRDSNQPVLSD